MKASVALACPQCGARVQCEVRDDTGGVIINNEDESIVVLTVNTKPMKRHTKENHEQ